VRRAFGAPALILALTCTAQGTAPLAAQAQDVALAEDEESPSEARALFLAGRVAFEEGRFEAAIRHFEASYELSQRAALLYNIAQCYDRLRRDRDAMEAFERYLQVSPMAENRSTVEARLRALRAAVASSERAAALSASHNSAQSSVAPEAAGSPQVGGFPLGPTLVLGTGALVTVTGGVLMWLGQRGGADVEDAKRGVSYSDLQDDLDRASRQWKLGQTLLGAGALGLSVGVVWLVLGRRDPQPAVDVAWLGNGLRLAGKF